MIAVYSITNPKNKVYVGSTKDLEYRWGKYKRLDCKRQTKLYNSLVKYGVSNHIFKVLIECEFNELYEWEHHFSNYYNSVKNGLNCQIPAFNDIKAITSEETKIKISNGNKGKKLSKETRDKISKQRLGKPSWNKGKQMSETHRANVKKAKQNLSEETRIKMSIAAKNKKLSDSHKQKISKSLIGNTRRRDYQLKINSNQFQILF